MYILLCIIIFLLYLLSNILFIIIFMLYLLSNILFKLYLLCNIINIIGPRGVGQSVTECVVKPLHDVKVTGSDKKSNRVKGWCGSGRVRSPGDFDGLDAPQSRFLKPQVNRRGF
jgi:hypothetical protein